jgi:predicted SnoaL-like aldol condensation-catalyzing enzyme
LQGYGKQLYILESGTYHVSIFRKLINVQESIKSDLKQRETNHKNIVLEYFQLIAQGKFKEGLRFFAPDCKTHNPYIAGSIIDLADAMITASKEMSTPEADFAVKHVLAEGDFVAAHTELLAIKSKPGEGGLRQVHLFRFDGDKIAEYWDTTQNITNNMPNAAGAF